MKKVKVAVIGCGYLGRWHVEKAISLEDAELVAIVENSQEGKSRASELFPDVRIELDLSEVLNDIDAAIVATPTSTHYSLVNNLINAGKHVFCEKPLTSSLEDAIKLNQIKLPNNLVLQVGHSERFHNVWKTIKSDSELKQFFDDKACITIDRYAPFKGRATDVDVVSDLMIHDLDLLWHLFEEEPKDVYAAGHKINTNKWDHVTAVVNFSSGRRAILICGRGHVEEQRKVQIIGKRGTLLIDLMNYSYSYASPGATPENIVKKSYEKADHLLEEQKLFYSSILKNLESPVSMSDGIKAVTWVDAVQRSLESGKAEPL
ncbi:MAG: hypothetical protein CME70_10025 [Halobacteriovorax sp.]|nr:hypothetical protein [Halobacteriovorax sp.]